MNTTTVADLIDWLDCCGIESHFVEKVRIALAEQPAQRRPLTNEKMLDISENFKSQYTHGGTTFDEFDALGFARAIEAAYGIKA